jgi:hypothetical protein
VDEEVTVELKLPEHTGQPFSSWGVGRVAHIDGGGAGIQLFGGEFAAQFSGEPEH